MLPRPGDEIEFVEDTAGFRVQKRVPASPFKKYRGYLKALAGRDPRSMITAVDTNALLDVLIPDAPHSGESERALAEAVRAGALLISEPTYAELAVHFADRADLDSFLGDTGIRLEPSGGEALYRAGRAWSEYLRRRPAMVACPQCGAPQEVRCDRCGASIQPRQHVVADFVIGAHALVHADRLLTWDRSYYATSFPDLKLG